MEKSYDVIVAGGGPSGLAIAAACSREGLNTLCVAPDVETPWANNTCAWEVEIRPLGMESLCDRIWPNIEIIFSNTSSKVKKGGYAHFDNAKLHRALISGVKETMTAEADFIKHDDKGSTITLRGGEKIRSTVVVDATGHSHRLLENPRREADSFQNVLGILARVDGHPFNLDHMILMDFRSDFLGKNVHPPTFLYAMPHAPDLVFLEETSLADNPGVPFDTLKDRLYQRTASLDINIKSVEFEEQGALAMNPLVPNLNQRVIGFGLAGGFVHPATGWSVARSLSQAGPAAESIAGGIRSGLSPDEIARKTYRRLWPQSLLRMRNIHKRGGEFFTRIGIRTLALFMKGFFSAPGTMWQTYLSWNATIMKVNRSLLPF